MGGKRGIGKKGGLTKYNVSPLAKDWGWKTLFVPAFYSRIEEGKNEGWGGRGQRRQPGWSEPLFAGKKRANGGEVGG